MQQTIQDWIPVQNKTKQKSLYLLEKDITETGKIKIYRLDNSVKSTLFFYICAVVIRMSFVLAIHTSIWRQRSIMSPNCSQMVQGKKMYTCVCVSHTYREGEWFLKCG